MRIGCHFTNLKCLKIRRKGNGCKSPFLFFSSYLYHGEHNGDNPNNRPQRHDNPKLGMLGFMTKQLQSYP